MLRQYIRSWLRASSTIAAFSVTFAYWLLGLINPGVIPKVLYQAKPIFMDMNYYSFFSRYSITCLMAPMLLIILQHNRRFFDNKYIVCRARGYREFWCLRLAVTATECLFFVISLYLLFISRGVILKPSEAGSIPIYLKCLPLQFLGFLALALIFCLISTLTGSGFAGFASAYSIVVFDFATFEMGKNIPTFINFSIELNPYATAGFIWVFLFMSLFVILLAYISARFLSLKEYRG